MKRSLKVLISHLIAKKNVQLGKDAYIWNSKIFGTHVHVDDGTGIEELYVIGSQSVTIGKHCALAGRLTIITSNHLMTKPNIQSKLQLDHFSEGLDHSSKGPVIIGNNVWIGLNVTILPGVKIGDGAVIGAGSVVTKSIEPFSIAAGNPAKEIRKRFPSKIIKKLLADPWWEWDQEKIKNSPKFFTKELS